MKKRLPRIQGERFLDPWNHRPLIRYLRSVRQWHGYVRFLGLPHLRDNPDVPIQRLFVQPSLAESHIQPDSDPAWWPPARPVFKELAEQPFLVVLGDPGSGKSTLLSWLAWQLAWPEANPARAALGPLVPLPLVLRELKLGPSLSWQGLLDAFLAHPVAAALDRQLLQDLLARGQAFFLLDGLDEVGGVELRKELRRVVWEGLRDWPACRWIAASRVVGYEEAAFESRLPWAREIGSGILGEKFEIDDQGELSLPVFELPSIARRHLTPFSDSQIRTFAQAWYRHHEPAPDLRRQRAQDLLQALRASGAIQQLARIPNLLTMMALIHRVRARLPQGRVRLYQDIAEAYLHSIDAFRGLDSSEYSLPEKRRWLARVGWQMQRRRGAEASSRAILAPQADVERWIAAAMQAEARSEDSSAGEAHDFVDCIGRRSGLLLPRGEGRFAFIHLSFQEHFAACYLLDLVTSRRWLPDYDEDGAAATDPSPAGLRALAEQTCWHETLVMLFELLAERPGWSDDLASWIFGDDFQRLGEAEAGEPQSENRAPPAHARAQLLVALLANPFTGLSPALRRRGLQACWTWELRWQQRSSGPSCWLAPHLTRPAGWQAFRGVSQRAQPRRLCLPSAKGLSAERTLGPLPELQRLHFRSWQQPDLAALGPLPQLRRLTVEGAPQLRDLCALGDLPSLQRLLLHLCAELRDLAPVAACTQLRELYLRDCPQLRDLSPLESARSLRVLSLHYCDAVQDLESVGSLAQLSSLRLTSLSGPADLSAVEGLGTLRELVLGDLQAVATLQPLAQLGGLRSLSLWDLPELPSLDPLGGLHQLRSLALGGLDLIDDLQPLAGLRQLRKAVLFRFPGCRDLAPLAGWSVLRELELEGFTDVTDLSPLDGLQDLEVLKLQDLDMLQDLSPLLELPALRSLTVRDCPGVQEDRAARALRERLFDVEIASYDDEE